MWQCFKNNPNRKKWPLWVFIMCSVLLIARLLAWLLFVGILHTSVLIWHLFTRFWNIPYMTGRSGGVWEVPESNPCCGQFSVFSRNLLRHEALGTDCTLTAVSAFHPPRDSNWVSALWLSNNTWRWADVWYIAAYRRTQRSSLQLGLRVGGHLALTDLHSEDPKWTLAFGFAP